jgi:uncharacterized membrane protein YkvA (DUF1232 family)
MMSEPSFFPTGLSALQADVLGRCVHEVRETPLAVLLQRVDEHLQRARDAHRNHPLVNVRLATALTDLFRAIVEGWETIPAEARPWLRGAMAYFVSTDDEEPDFSSPLGFEDDVDVLNACLRLAGLDELCLNPEDYD